VSRGLKPLVSRWPGMPGLKSGPISEAKAKCSPQYTRYNDWSMASKPRDRGKKVWLVTWDWCGDHARREDRIAAIFKPQLGGRRVLELVEFIYSSEYSLRERLSFALNPKANPYPAQFSQLDSGRWEGEIICGHNPFLRARLVDDFWIDSDGNASWRERERPRVALD